MKAFFDLITGRAFRADPMDITVPLAQRMRGRRFIALSGNVGSSVAQTDMKLVAVDVSSSGVVKIGTPEILTAKGGIEGQLQILRNFADRMDTRFCAVLMPEGFSTMVSDKAMPLSDVETLHMARENPGKLLSLQKEPDRVYSIVRHPKLKTVLVFSHHLKRVRESVDLVMKAGLDLVRLQCGTASICGYLIGNHPDVITKESDLFVVDGNQTFHLQVDKGDWPQNPAGRPDANVDPFAGMRMVLQKIIPRRTRVPLSVVNTGKLDLTDFFQKEFPMAQVSFLFRDDTNMRQVTLPSGDTAHVSIIEFQALCHN